MSKKQVLKELESVIRTVCRDIKKRETAGADKIAKLAQLVNSYNRLNQENNEVRDPMEWGTP